MSSVESSDDIPKLDYTGERFMPELSGDIALEHIHRYLLARDAAKGLCVLDIACGEGYGSAMLAETADRVIGVDISAEAIAHAQASYAKDNLSFFVGAADSIPLPDRSVDLVVSFETIEHHDKHREMLAEIKRVLRPDGNLVMSSPDKREFSEVPGHVNPFHVKELYAGEFFALVSEFFANVRSYGQRVLYGSCIACADAPTSAQGYELSDGRLLGAPGVPRPVYVLAVASDAETLPLASGVLDQPIAETGVVRFWSRTVSVLEDRIREGESSAARLSSELEVASTWGECLSGELRSTQDRLSECEEQRVALVYRLNALQSGPAWRLAQPFYFLETRWPRVARGLLAPLRLLRDAMGARLLEGVRARRVLRRIARSGLFDEQWYVPRNADVVLAGTQPLVHWTSVGWREGRDPGPGFSTQRYLGAHPELRSGSVDPLTHHLSRQSAVPAEGSSAALFSPGPPSADVSGPPDFAHRIWRSLPIPMDRKVRIKRRIVAFVRRLPFVGEVGPVAAESSPFDPDAAVEAVALTTLTPPNPDTLPIRLIAFYLPQYHPIPENDEWWGRGFTEWRNVVRGQPRFVGHYQPHLPGELGFYDLRILEVQQRQVDLARLYGLGGFCFYFYWFAGKRLLELPVRQYLDNPVLDLPFCLCWANENWSRRWDGRERDILMAQKHSPEDDLAFIAHIAPYLRDPRYIRVQGRPLLLVYRPSLLPSPAATAGRWRDWCRAQGIGEIWLAYTQSFDGNDPADFGFDAAIEFPPNYVLPQDITSRVELLDPTFQGSVFDWRGFVEASRRYSEPGYTLYRGVCPSWDNEARRQGSGTTFHGATPQEYAEWLENAAADTVSRFADRSSRLVFVNAWNEWAEGAHLEPDQRYGYAFLQATRDALTRAPGMAPRKIVVVSHDAHLNGAQYLALNIARELGQSLSYRVHMVVLGPGPLLPEYRKLGSLTSLDGVAQDGAEAQSVALDLAALGYRDAVVNSAASGLFATALAAAGIRVISLVHELPDLIRRHRLEPHVLAIAASASKVVFAAPAVLHGFQTFASLETDKIVIRPQGLYKRNRARSSEARHDAGLALRSRFGLPSGTEIVIGVGYGDRRKGIDLFVAVALEVVAHRPNAAFIWVGNLEHGFEQSLVETTANPEYLSRLFFPGHENDTDVFYAGADVLAMTSREDPFPSVLLESFDVGVPAVGFEGAGGFTEFAAHGCLRLAPAFDTRAFAQEIEAFLSDPSQRQAAGEAGRALISADFGFRRYVCDLLSLSACPPPRVSVVVPNFNYLRYLPGRIRSILSQTLPIYQLIVLDDASADGSQEWLRTELPGLFESADVILNEANSGSVFSQWLAGVQRARGNLVWIAEADDLADPQFLAEAVRAFDDPAVVLSYTQSKQIDSQGTVLCDHYLDYVADVSTEHWRKPYVEDGIEETRLRLAVKNTIPNVSAVVFRREPLLQALEQYGNAISSFRVAGDWRTYVEVLKLGKVAFTPVSLNLHRRHSSSVTISGFDLGQLTEIRQMQQHVRDQFDVPPEVVLIADAYAELLSLRLGNRIAIPDN